MPMLLRKHEVPMRAGTFVKNDGTIKDDREMCLTN